LKHRSIQQVALRLFGFCGIALSLAGCVEAAGQREPVSAVPQPTNMARREGVSPHGASVTIRPVEGVSTAVSQRLTPLIEAQADTRDVHLADAKSANYLVRGYVTAEQVEGGALYAIVYDVYDSKKRRAQRIDDRVFAPGAVASLDQINDAAMAQIAAKSAEDIAAVMTNTPEAVAAAATTDKSTPQKSTDVATANEGGTTQVAGSQPVSSPAATAYAAQPPVPAQQALAAASLR